MRGAAKSDTPAGKRVGSERSSGESYFVGWVAIGKRTGQVGLDCVQSEGSVRSTNLAAARRFRGTRRRSNVDGDTSGSGACGASGICYGKRCGIDARVEILIVSSGARLSH